MSLTKYDRYKDSGVDWLGNIPSHWEVKRIKDIFLFFGSGTTPKSSNPIFYEEGSIPWLNTTDLNNGFVNDTKNKITLEALNTLSLKLYPPKSIAIAMYGQGKTRGTVGYLNIHTTTNQAACVMYKTLIANEKYILWWFISKYSDIRGINIGATQPNMNQDFIKFLTLQLPPLQEQQQIANYLDQQTKTINKKIKLLKAKIAHYQALKKSLINETVCRGLDKTVALKDSGIEWIGAIPEHWEVKRLKDLGFLYSGLSGKKGADFNQENNPNNRGFIPFTNIANNTYLDKNHLGVVEVKENENQNQVQKHDLFFLMSSEGYEDLGKSALLVDNVGEVYLNSFCKGFRLTNNNIHSYYLNYLLLSDSYRNTMMIEGKGFTRINLKMNKINDFIIAVPPLKEQQEIAKYLDEKTGIIDQIIANIQSQVERLKELRKSLINEVVAGKVRVPEMENVK